MKKLLHPFKMKLIWEAFVKSWVVALTAGAVCEFIFLLIMHLLALEPDKWLIAVVFGIPFVLSGLLLFGLRHYPNMKRVVTRVDETGLEERVITMLEYKENNDFVVELQRNDALKHLEKVHPKQMKLTFRKKPFILCAIVVSLTVGFMFVPYTIMGSIFAAESSVNEEEAQMIKELIEELRQKVKDTEVSDEIKEQLNEVVDELEENLSEEDSTLEKTAKISQAESEIKDIIENAVTKNKIGTALQQYESTKALGNAISDGDTDAVSEALSDMQDTLTALEGQEQGKQLNTVSSDIASALALSGVEAGDALYDALHTFGTSLTSEATEAVNGVDVDTEVSSSVSQAETEIIAALEEQASIEATAEQFGDIIDETKDELLGNESEKSEEESKSEDEKSSEEQDGEKADGEKADSEKADGEASGNEMSGGGESQGGVEGEGDDSVSSKTESIYDPTSGSVKYGEVFDAYYGEYLAALEAGEVPDDLQAIIDQYYAALNK